MMTNMGAFAASLALREFDAWMLAPAHWARNAAAHPSSAIGTHAARD
jgi:hypothetical protein